MRNTFYSILVFCLSAAVFGALVSLIALASPIRKLIQHSIGLRKIITSVFIVLVWIIAFLLLTNLRAEVAIIVNLSHGGLEVSGVWDDFSPDKRDGGLVYIDKETGEEIYVSYQEINRRKDEIRRNRPVIKKEIWVRNIILPSLRQHCYTNNEIACHWADKNISVSNDWSEWYNYLVNLVISLLAGFVSGSIIWLYGTTRPG